MLLKLAWRNIWRNKRRTLITLASVFFAMFLSSLMMSLKEGKYNDILNSVVGNYVGYAQVHAKNYWEDKTPDFSFKPDQKLIREINRIEAVNNILERIEGISLVVSDEATKVGVVAGIDVIKERDFNRLDERVVDGEYLNPDDKSVIIGSGLASYLKVKVNDTIVLLGQGYHGSAAAGKYKVKGLVKFGSPELSKQLVFLPVKEAQWFYSMEDMVSSLIIQFNRTDKVSESVKKLKENVGSEYEVMDWKEMLPDVYNLISTDRMEGYVFMFILYLVVSFGIFGTILMMLSERKREFGVLISIGMKKSKLAFVVWLEVILISALGAVSGIVGVLPLCYYLYFHPVQLGKELQKITEEYGMEAVLRPSTELSVFLQQGAVVLLVSIILSLYPVFNILRLNTIKAIRS